MVNNITNRQMFFILFLTLITFTVINISKIMVKAVGTGSWIPIILTSIIFAFAALIIVNLNNMFKSQMLFDYSQILIGKTGAYLLSAYYLLYFLIICSFLFGQMATILKVNFLYKTPQVVTVFTGLIVCGYGAYKGITNVARLFEIYGLILLIAAVVLHLLMIITGEFKQILPIFNSADIGKYLAAMKDSIFSFLGIEVLLFIPFTNKNGKKSKKVAFLTLIGIGLFYVLVVESSMMVVGRKDIVYYNDTLIVALRRVEATFLQFIERVDFLYLTIGFMANIAGLMIIYTGVVEYACRIFKKVKRFIIVIIVGVLILALYMVTQKIKDFSKIFSELIIYPGLASAIFIPTLLLIIAKVKKHAGKIS